MMIITTINIINMKPLVSLHQVHTEWAPLGAARFMELGAPPARLPTPQPPSHAAPPPQRRPTSSPRPASSASCPALWSRRAACPPDFPQPPPPPPQPRQHLPPRPSRPRRPQWGISGKPSVAQEWQARHHHCSLSAQHAARATFPPPPTTHPASLLSRSALRPPKRTRRSRTTPRSRACRTPRGTSRSPRRGRTPARRRCSSTSATTARSTARVSRLSGRRGGRRQERGGCGCGCSAGADGRRGAAGGGGDGRGGAHLRRICGAAGSGPDPVARERLPEEELPQAVVHQEDRGARRRRGTA